MNTPSPMCCGQCKNYYPTNDELKCFNVFCPCHKTELEKDGCGRDGCKCGHKTETQTPHDCENNIESNMTPPHCRICGKATPPSTGDTRIDEIVREFEDKCEYGKNQPFAIDYMDEILPQIKDWLRTTLTTYHSNLIQEAEERGRMAGKVKEFHLAYPEGFKEGRTQAIQEAIEKLHYANRYELDGKWNAARDEDIKILQDLLKE